MWETSLLWAQRPELVHLDEIAAEAVLPGVIGDDPRGRASAALGSKGVEAIADQAAAAIERACARDALANEQLLGAVDAGLQALLRLAGMRAERPKHTVPDVQTPAWIDHVVALHSGDYAAASDAAHRKWADPAA